MKRFNVLYIMVMVHRVTVTAGFTDAFTV